MVRHIFSLPLDPKKAPDPQSLPLLPMLDLNGYKMPASKTFPLFILVTGKIYHPLLCFNLFSVVEVYLSNDLEKRDLAVAQHLVRNHCWVMA